MKSVLKVGVLAIALGMFVASCNNAGTGSENEDSSNVELSEPAPEVAPAAPVDSAAAPVDSAAGTDTSNQ